MKNSNLCHFKNCRQKAIIYKNRSLQYCHKHRKFCDSIYKDYKNTCDNFMNKKEFQLFDKESFPHDLKKAKKFSEQMEQCGRKREKFNLEGCAEPDYGHSKAIRTALDKSKHIKQWVKKEEQKQQSIRKENDKKPNVETKLKNP